MARNSETADGRAKRSEIWDLGVDVKCIRGTFDLVVFQVILGSFSAFVSKWPLTA